ncbi:MAG: response regulator [Anaerolineae bacterium]|jgi:two-component system cell cycle response regulator DivK
MLSGRLDEAAIVVVEDNFQNYVLITRLLACLGVTDCVWKASGRQVLEMAESLPNIDLILMDILLPDSDGYSVVDRLRAHQGFEDTRIVAVTVDSSLDNLRRAARSGFDGFISKPLKPDLFPLQIRRLLEGEQVWDRR